MAHAVLVFESIYVDQFWAKDLEEHIHYVLDKLMEQVDQDPEDGSEPIPTPSGEKFDGCEVCVRREIMVMTLMATMDGAVEGRVERRLVA